MSEKYKTFPKNKKLPDYLRTIESPTAYADRVFGSLIDIICDLEEEIAQLKRERSERISESIKNSNIMAARTLQIALNGGFDNMTTQDKKACGYEVDEATKESTDEV